MHPLLGFKSTSKLFSPTVVMCIASVRLGQKQFKALGIVAESLNQDPYTISVIFKFVVNANLLFLLAIYTIAYL